MLRLMAARYCASGCQQPPPVGWESASISFLSREQNKASKLLQSPSDQDRTLLPLNSFTLGASELHHFINGMATSSESFSMSHQDDEAPFLQLQSLRRTSESSQPVFHSPIKLLPGAICR